MLRGTAVKWSAGAYRKLPRFFYIIILESGWWIPLAYRWQPAVVLPWGRGRQASGKKRAGGSGKNDDYICIFTAQDFEFSGLKVIPKASAENEKKGSVKLPPEGSEDLQWWLPGTSTTPRYPEMTGGGFQLPCSGKKLHHWATTLHQSSHCYRKSRDIYRRGWGAGDMMVASMCNSKFIPQIPTACLSVLDYHQEQCNRHVWRKWKVDLQII